MNYSDMRGLLSEGETVIFSSMKIGVYGLGRFGSFWAGCLQKTGNEIICCSRSSHVLPDGVRMADEDEVLSSDILFFCVTISAFESVLERVGGRIGENTIVCDTCSVKTYPSEWMDKNLPSSIYRIATHPMFGPDSGRNGLEGLPVVMCPPSLVDERYEKVRNLFVSMGLVVREMSADEHDREAAFSQGVTHFIGRILSEMNLKPSAISTKGYKALLEIVEQTCNDPVSLFTDLQLYNPYTKDMRHSLRVAIENVGYTLEKGGKR